MRSLLLLVLLVASASGCCCTGLAPCTSGYCPVVSGADYPCYTPGYRRACYPAYRPIDSAFAP